MLTHHVVSSVSMEGVWEPGLGLPTSGLSAGAGAEEELVWRQNPQLREERLACPLRAFMSTVVLGPSPVDRGLGLGRPSVWLLCVSLNAASLLTSPSPPPPQFHLGAPRV